jgi:hypothetical protein
MVRGGRPAGDPLPVGTRIDIRKHTKHVLAPRPEDVEALLENPTASASLKRFREAYRHLIAERYREDQIPFNSLAEIARAGDVYLGCSCPTKRQTNVAHCHTVLALRFMQKHYPDLDVRFPEG